LIFSDGVRSDVNPVLADRRLIELFETAGARAVRACLSGETRLGYYLDALRTAVGPLD
jgi:Holliday junction resolvase